MHFDIEGLELNKVLKMVEPFCQTNLAKEQVNRLLPTSNMGLIKTMLDEVSEAYEATVKLSNLPLGGFHDKKDAVLRASIGGILSEEELYDIASNLTCVRNVIKYKQNLDSLKLETINLEPYFSALTPDKKLEDNIFQSIGPDLKVMDNATMDLFRIRKKLKMEETHLRNYMNSYLLSHASKLQEGVIALRDGHLTVPIKAEFKNQIKGIVRDSSSSGTTYFIEPEEAYKITAQIELIKQDEKKEVESILKGLSLLINGASEDLLKNHENLILLDVIFAKAEFSLKHNMIKPQINDSGIISIKNGAHPLISEDVVVKNDVELGKNYDTIIITGPNTGGKTVLLKMVGLLTLMMQTGLFVPAKEGTVLNVFDNVFSDIGDEQSIEQSLSTFSSHMTNVVNILNNLTYNSLVLLDELGSGTDPKEGASLAIAIIEYLSKKGSRVITTTHYSDLKAFAYDNPRIINASVEFKVETLKPTYKLQIGVAGRSNALLISKRLGLNNEIIEEASRIYDNQADDTSSLINKIDEENEKITALKQEYEEKMSTYETSLRELEVEKLKLEQSYNKIIKQAQNEASKIISDAKESSKSIIEELNKLKDEKYYEEHKLADIKHKVKSLDIERNEENLFNDEIKVGDLVYIKSYDKNGEVKRIKGDKFEIQVGPFTMTFERKELALAKSNIKAKKPLLANKKKPSTPLNTSSGASLRLDLRGYRYEEVAPEVDKFIDQAYSHNMGMIQIIHGFGTGAVREAVYAYLKKCPYVKSYRFGGEGEGLNGCTVVYLK